MKISMNWISDYVDISNIDVSKLALSFTMSTAEIEEVTYMGTETTTQTVTNQITDFSYTGAVQTYTAPATGTSVPPPGSPAC